MGTFAGCLLGLVVAGYLVLGGGGLGVGMLLRYLGHDAAERHQVRVAIGRLLPAQLRLLVATAGALAGCFPGLLGGLWPVLAVVVAGVATRVAGLSTRGGDAPLGHADAGVPAGVGERGRDALVLAGSWVETGGWAWAVASLLGEHPGRPAYDPAAAVTTVGVVLLFLAHGMGCAARWMTGEPFQRARLLAGPRAGRSSFVLSSVVLAALPLAGARLPLSQEQAPALLLGFSVALLCLAGVAGLAPLVPRSPWASRLATPRGGGSGEANRAEHHDDTHENDNENENENDDKGENP